MSDFCPLCGRPLIPQERVVEERVPSTVPEYFSRSQQAKYRRIDRWVEVRCLKGHRFKQRGSRLYGMGTK